MIGWLSGWMDNNSNKTNMTTTTTISMDVYSYQ